MNKEVVKEIRKIVTIVAIVALLIVYSGKAIGTVEGIVDVFTPFFSGLAIAFVLNIPMVLIEEKLLKGWTGKFTGKIKRGVSMTAAILIVLAVIFLVVFSIVPQMADTFRDIGDRIPGFYNETVDFAKQLTKDYPQINEIINEMSSKEQDWGSILGSVGSFMQSGTMGSIVSSTVNVASSIAVFLFKAIIAICFAIYLLVNKEKLLRHVKIVCQTYLPKNVFEYIYHATLVLTDTFKKFIAGQCVEAIILGLIFAVCMAIFKIPYVLLISVLIAFTALIPVAGAFIGCAVGAFLILMVSPFKMVQFLILFVVLQQIENKLIYPRIVGSSVGLPAIWVFVAVTVGGSLSGVVGMLVFIPLASTMYVLLKEDIIRKQSNSKKNSVVKATNSDVLIDDISENSDLNIIDENGNSDNNEVETNVASSRQNRNNNQKRRNNSKKKRRKSNRR